MPRGLLRPQGAAEVFRLGNLRCMCTKDDVAENLAEEDGVGELRIPIGPASSSTSTAAGAAGTHQQEGESPVLYIFWDGENLPIGRESMYGSFNANSLVDRLITVAGHGPDGWESTEEFRSRLGLAKIHLVIGQSRGNNGFHPGHRERESLIDVGVTIIDPGSKKGAVDMKIKDLLGQLARERDPVRTKVLLMGGDRDFAAEARTLREHGFRHVVLLHSGNARQSYRGLFSSSHGEWESIRKQVGLGALPNQPSTQAASFKTFMQVLTPKQSGARRATIAGVTPLSAGALSPAGTPQGGPVCFPASEEPRDAGSRTPSAPPDDPFVMRFASEPEALQRASIDAQLDEKTECGGRIVGRVPVRLASCLRGLVSLVTALVAVIVVLGLIWVCIGYNAAATSVARMEDGVCRVSRGSTEPVDVSGGGSCGAHGPSIVLAIPSITSYRATPSASCLAPLERGIPCRDGDAELCWTPLGDLGQESLLTFFSPHVFRPSSYRMQCGDLLHHASRLQDGFPCTFALEDPNGFGVFAMPRSSLSALSVEVSALSNCGGGACELWLLCVAVGIVRGLVFLVASCWWGCFSSTSRCNGADSIAAVASAVDIAVVAAEDARLKRSTTWQQGERPEGRRKGRKKRTATQPVAALAGTAAHLHKPLLPEPQDGDQAPSPDDQPSHAQRFVRCLSRAPLPVLAVIALSGLAVVVWQYVRTQAGVAALEDARCRLVSRDYEDDGESWWLSDTTRPCLVQLEMSRRTLGDNDPAKVDPSWAPPPAAFIDADGWTRLMFVELEAHSRWSLARLVHKYAGHDGFECSYAEGDIGGWGVLSARKDALPGTLALALGAVSRTGFPLTASLLSGAILLAIAFFHLALSQRSVARYVDSAKAAMVAKWGNLMSPRTSDDDDDEDSSGFCQFRLLLLGSTVSLAVFLTAYLGWGVWKAQAVVLRLEGGLCRLASDGFDDSAWEPESVGVASPWRRPSSELPLLTWQRTCQVDVALHTDWPEASQAWTQFPERFLGEDGLVRTTFPLTASASAASDDGGDETTQRPMLSSCEAIVADIRGHNNGVFDCSFSPMDSFGMGVVARPKAALEETLLLAVPWPSTILGAVLEVLAVVAGSAAVAAICALLQLSVGCCSRRCCDRERSAERTFHMGALGSDSGARALEAGEKKPAKNNRRRHTLAP